MFSFLSFFFDEKVYNNNVEAKNSTYNAYAHVHVLMPT